MDGSGLLIHELSLPGLIRTSVLISGDFEPLHERPAHTQAHPLGPMGDQFSPRTRWERVSKAIVGEIPEGEGVPPKDQVEDAGGLD